MHLKLIHLSGNWLIYRLKRAESINEIKRGGHRPNYQVMNFFTLKVLLTFFFFKKLLKPLSIILFKDA